MAESLPSLLAAVDRQKAKSANFLRTLVSSPNDAMEQLAAEIDRTLEEARRDPGMWLGRGGGGMAGIIRRGGDPALSLIHQASLDRLRPKGGYPSATGTMEWAEPVTAELASPSMAINRGAITQNFGDSSGTVTLVARPDVFDPARMPQAQLFNRDAYTPRGSDFYGSGATQAMRGMTPEELGNFRRLGGLRETVKMRLAERIGMPGEKVELPYGADMRLRESGVAGDSGWLGGFQGTEHTGAIRSSPRFRSFKEFETSPKGSRLLTPGNNTLAPTEAVMRAARELDEAAWKLVRGGNPAARYIVDSNDMGRAVLMGEWRNLPGAQEFAREAVIPYRNALSFAPSHYAELKVPGAVGLHGGNWAGAIIRPGTGRTTSINALSDALAGRGIPTVVPQPLDEEGLGWLARQMSERSLER